MNIYIYLYISNTWNFVPWQRCTKQEPVWNPLQTYCGSVDQHVRLFHKTSTFGLAPPSRHLWFGVASATKQGADLSPDVICISAVISACGQGRQWQVALGLLHQVKASSQVCYAVGGWLRRNVNPAGRRHHQSLDSIFAVPTLAKKIDIQFNPQLQSINTAKQRAHCESMLRGEPVFCSWILYCSVLWDCSWTLLFSWISPQNDQLSTILQVSPDVICFSAAISACEKAGEWQMAVELLKEMEDMTRCWVCSGQKWLRGFDH